MTWKDERPAGGSGAPGQSDNDTDHRHSNPRRRQIGCFLCGAQRDHDPGCLVGTDLPRQRSGCGRPCQTYTFAAMAQRYSCECPEATAAVGGVA